VRWFKGRRREAEVEQTRFPALKVLEATVVITSLGASGPIDEAWPTITGENPMSAKSNFLVRIEMLAFFLHMLSRFALAVGGANARAVLQDAIVPNAIRGLITACFDASGAAERFDVDEWEARMVSNIIGVVNEAELDYSSCNEVVTGGEAGLPALLREENMAGKLAGRIARQVDWKGDVHGIQLRLLIATTAVEALTRSGLRQQVENACRALQ